MDGRRASGGGAPRRSGVGPTPTVSSGACVCVCAAVVSHSARYVETRFLALHMECVCVCVMSLRRCDEQARRVWFERRAPPRTRQHRRMVSKLPHDGDRRAARPDVGPAEPAEPADGARHATAVGEAVKRRGRATGGVTPGGAAPTTRPSGGWTSLKGRIGGSGATSPRSPSSAPARNMRKPTTCSRRQSTSPTRWVSATLSSRRTSRTSNSTIVRQISTTWCR